MSDVLDAWRWGCLGVVLLIVVYSDWRYGKIPNRALLFGFCAALVAVAVESISSPIGAWTRFGAVALGLTCGFLLSLPFYLLRLLGAGDVKLLAVVGAFLGWPAIAAVMILALLINGLLSVLIALRRGVLRRMLANVWQGSVRAALWVSSGGAAREAVQVQPTGYRMPHALGVALAVVIYVDQRWVQWLPWWHG